MHFRLPKRVFSNTFLVCLMASMCLMARVASAQALAVRPDHPDGRYDVGETITWNIDWRGQQPVAEVRCTLKKNGLQQIDQGVVKLDEQGEGEISAVLDEPGTLLLEVVVPGSDSLQRQTEFGGAVVAAENIEPSAPRPEDFDAFWAEKLSELAEVPANPVLTKEESGKPGVDYWKITMDNIRGTKIQGQLARPATGDSFPALLIVQWAGVYKMDKSWATDRAAEGWLVLNILAHDLPIDEPDSFYREQSEGPLQDYWKIGNDDRDTSYFLRMYLSCYQAAEYLTQRPDWNHQTLVVMGTSQGGQQTLVTAALHPGFTAALACVPAGCDMLGPDEQRAPGWPMWFWNTDGKDADAVRQASRYYDVVNFAPRITCPVLVGIGLIDQVCPPAGVFAAVNQTNGPVEAIALPRGDHPGSHNTHAEYLRRCYGAWLPALQKGHPAPLPAEAVPLQ